MKTTKKVYYSLGFLFVLFCTILSVSTLGVILIDIFSKGISVLSFDFIFDYPRKGMTEGGIFPAIVGTTFVTLITAIFSIPLGISTAIYLNEYAKNTWFTRIIRSSIRNLAGVPSIVYGLFGVALFVQAFRMGTSLLASGLTLGLLSLPYIITATEEALKTVPENIKEGALALGATKWETIFKIIVPASMSGIITGIILALSRATGETAPILFTGVFFYQRFLPTSLFDEFMALPYHLFILSTQHHNIEGVRPLAYGTALVLLILVFVLNLVAFIIRAKYRKQF
ncbi:phosphate ABC transporter membrane protein 2 (PhoT family) [Tenacibaculum adriaticum]|uniref:Phosphate transport system permease protein PstA n=1 Tax=Tenacibaculum adriaticum TaxID=413713 RepID=A0A5S5DSR1_9FLAO|nr:phosphate ABC transporter permease PstA [Tenacibaculum adriaticum]TYP98963.1 phosphate ABC transporter membrane protein 2 (PhoT family) [Tenacibaculum adriaticum]